MVIRPEGRPCPTQVFKLELATGTAPEHSQLRSSGRWSPMMIVYFESHQTVGFAPVLRPPRDLKGLFGLLESSLAAPAFGGDHSMTPLRPLFDLKAPG